MDFQHLRTLADSVRIIPLKHVLLLSGALQDPRDKTKWRTTKGILSVNAMKFTNWTQNVAGGGAIDLAIHLHDLPFTHAVQWLAAHTCLVLHDHTHTPLATTPQPARQLQLPRPNPRKISPVRHYLIQQRALPAQLIDPLINTGLIYADDRGNAVFLMMAKANKPIGAELRAASSSSWHGLAPGTRKDQGLFHIRGSRLHTIVLCESAIDALSCHVIHPDCLCVSTAGARTKPKWLPALIKRGYNLYCGYDADPAGDRAAQNMITLNPNIKRLRPPTKDWNETLIRLKKNISIPSDCP